MPAAHVAHGEHEELTLGADVYVEPDAQGEQTVFDVGVHAADANCPGGHTEQAVQVEALTTLLYVAPATHAVHTVSLVMVHPEATYVPMGHACVQLAQSGAVLLLFRYVRPRTQPEHTVLDVGVHAAKA